MKFHISCHEGNTIDVYRQGVEKYIQDYPNLWDSVFYFRCEDIDPNNEVVTYRVAVRSRFSWQVSNKVIQMQGEFHRFLVSLAIKLHIKYDAPNKRSIMYYGGSLVNGGIKDYKTKVLTNSNINNEHQVIAGIVPKGVDPHGCGMSFGRMDAAPHDRSRFNANTRSRTEGYVGDASAQKEIDATDDAVDDTSSLNSGSAFGPEKANARKRS